MKSERRHELEHNELAVWLARNINAIKPYTSAILGVAILSLAVVGAYTFLTRQSSAEATGAWNELIPAMDEGRVRVLDDMAEQYAGSDAGDWAALVAGDMHRIRGGNMLLDNKANANRELRKAVKAYNKVIDSQRPMFRQRAKYGLARTLEAHGKLEKASVAYKQVVEEFPDGAYAAASQRRVDDLQKPSIRELYDKISNFVPKPISSDIPGILDGQPSFDIDTLNEGGDDSTFDSTFELLKDFDSVKGPLENGIETLDETDAAPSGNSAEKPAETEKSTETE